MAIKQIFAKLTYSDQIQRHSRGRAKQMENGHTVIKDIRVIKGKIVNRSEAELGGANREK